MSEFWASIGLAPRSTVSVVRADGWVVARYPDIGRSLNIGKSGLLELIKKSPKGTYYSAVSPADGLSRIVGYRKIAHWPLIAIAGIEMSEALQLFWQALKLQLAFGLPLLILLVGFAIWIAWLLHAYAGRNLELEMAVERNHFLFREIHHRVKNNLQTVAALLRLQARRIDSVEGKLALEEAVRRIGSIAIVHETLSQEVLEEVAFDEIADRLGVLVTDVGARADRVVVRRKGSFGVLPNESATALAMVLTELLQNAVEHGYPESDRPGSITVEPQRLAGRLRVTVDDDGTGLPPGFDPDGSPNLGLSIVRTLVESELGGILELRAGPEGGARVVVDVPLDP
jgi:two-component sensor histidine kinase